VAMPIGLYAKVMGWACSLLLALLVCRGVASGTLKKYPMFCSYAIAVLITTIGGLSLTGARLYFYYYWISEWVGMFLGIGVTWEIFMRVLAHYPGVRRLAWMLLAIIFSLVLVHSAAGGPTEKFSYVALARDLRTVQAIVLLTLFALVAYYAIPLGHNVRGIAIGYVFLVATSILNLSLQYYFGKSYHPFWKYGAPLEFAASLTIWTVTLWSYQPNPRPLNEDMELDYEWLSGQAVRAMVRLRTHLIHPDNS
jgi:hypothetical protein